MSYIKDLFRFEFESDSSASYLVLRNVEEDKLQKLQVEMIEQNPNADIIPLSIRVKNNEYMIFYNITSKITLNQLLKRQSLKKNEFLDLLISISKTISECKNYYAYDKNFAIDGDLIYVNPANLDASLIYIPVSFQVSFKDVFIDFVKKLIDDVVRIDENEDLGFIQKIRVQLREDIFSMQEFIRILSGFRYKNDAKDDPNKNYIQETMLRNNQNNVIDTGKNDLGKGRDNLIELKTPKAEVREQKSVINIPRKSNNTFVPMRDNSSTGSSGTILAYSKNSIYAAIGLQAAGILVLIISVIGVLKSVKQDFSLVLGVGIVVGAIDFLIMRKLLDKDKMIPVHKNESRSVDDRCKEKVADAKPDVLKGPEGGVRSPINEPGTEILCDNCKDDTVLLKESPSLPYLIGKNEGKNIKIIINKDSFLIGRLKSQVDCEINNSSISKVHTEIIKKEGRYYIKDLNSSNGTYVNSERIKSNFEFEIKNHDVIRIANMEFEFCAV
ncbi:MAG TPA: DUF6382 domain-containing protein [Pseudobacteroides sp.]|uniref:DUF6382 domain-containing protein n=1 Tax=Pseudobacteroides sp. TaxID=1968840 RepID=UPI002F91FE6C